MFQAIKGSWKTSSQCNPIEDMKSALMLNAMSEREAEIFIEALMGKRKLDGDLVLDLMFGKLRRSLEK